MPTKQEIGTFQLEAVTWDENMTGLYRINTKTGKVEVLNRNELSDTHLKWVDVSTPD